MSETFFPSHAELLAKLRVIRKELEKGFSEETAYQGVSALVPSAGQCAVAALILHEVLGGNLVSAFVQDESHWFNRLRTAEGEVDVDITADQFGDAPIRVSEAGKLYPKTRLRALADISSETLHRSALLKRRSGIANEPEHH